RSREEHRGSAQAPSGTRSSGSGSSQQEIGQAAGIPRATSRRASRGFSQTVLQHQRKQETTGAPETPTRRAGAGQAQGPRSGDEARTPAKGSKECENARAENHGIEKAYVLAAGHADHEQGNRNEYELGLLARHSRRSP